MSEDEIKLYVFARSFAEAAKQLRLDRSKAGLAMIAEGFGLMFSLSEADACALATISIHNAADLMLRLTAAQRVTQDNTAIAVEDMGRG